MQLFALDTPRQAILSQKIRKSCGPRSFVSARQGELKYSAVRFVRLCPQPAAMFADDRTADRQLDPHTAGFCRVEPLTDPEF